MHRIQFTIIKSHGIRYVILKYLLSDYDSIWNMWLLCNQTIKKPKQTRSETLCCETRNIEECYGLEFTAAENKLEEVLWLRDFLY